jgi:hypothetical protein
LLISSCKLKEAHYPKLNTKELVPEMQDSELPKKALLSKSAWPSVHSCVALHQ